MYGSAITSLRPWAICSRASHSAKPPGLFTPDGGSNELIALSSHRQHDAAIGVPA